MSIKQGWTGRVYEDFDIGDIYPHPLGRTVLAADNIWFTLLTQNTNPIHFDAAYAAKTEFKKPLVDSTFTLALATVDGWAFDVEVLTIARRHGLRIVAVPIEWRYDELSRVSVVGDSLGMLRDVLRIRLRAARGQYDRRP